MIRWTIRAAINVAIASLFAAGCQASPSATPGQSGPSTSPTTGATAAPPPTPLPTALPSPSETAVACPTDLPTVLASPDALADPSCYGTSELTIDGWLADEDVYVDNYEWTPSWTMPLAGLYGRSPTTREWIFDHLMASSFWPGVSVVTPPESGIELLGRGRWATVHGHFNDPAASACQVANWAPNPDYGEQSPPKPSCERLFVVSSVQALEHPAPDCPTSSPMRLATFLAADFRCFLGHEVKVDGWEDIGEGFGGTTAAYGIKIGSLRYAHAQLVTHRWESDQDHDPVFPYTVAGSGVAFDKSALKVTVTIHLGHPAVKTCRPQVNEGWTWSPPIAWAQHRCERLVVITDVRVRS